jgi:hypothetical protein
VDEKLYAASGEGPDVLPGGVDVLPAKEAGVQADEVPILRELLRVIRVFSMHGPHPSGPPPLASSLWTIRSPNNLSGREGILGRMAVGEVRGDSLHGGLYTGRSINTATGSPTVALWGSHIVTSRHDISGSGRPRRTVKFSLALNNANRP